MDLHPLHAFYLGRSHGEVATVPLRERLVQEGASAGDGPLANDPGNSLRAALLGVAAVVAVARPIAKPSVDG